MLHYLACIDDQGLETFRMFAYGEETTLYTAQVDAAAWTVTNGGSVKWVKSLPP